MLRRIGECLPQAQHESAAAQGQPAPVCKTGDHGEEVRVVPHRLVRQHPRATTRPTASSRVRAGLGPEDQQARVCQRADGPGGQISVAALWNVIRPIRKTGLFAYAGWMG